MTATSFVVDTGGRDLRHVAADRLTVTKRGDLRFYQDRQLVGIVKEGFWYRCYVEAPVAPAVRVHEFKETV